MWVVPDKVGIRSKMLYTNSIDGEFYSDYNTVTKKQPRDSGLERQEWNEKMFSMDLGAGGAGDHAHRLRGPAGAEHRQQNVYECYLGRDQGGSADRKWGTLTMATSPDFAPYEFYAIDEHGEAVLAGL